MKGKILNHTRRCWHWRRYWLAPLFSFSKKSIRNIYTASIMIETTYWKIYYYTNELYTKKIQPCQTLLFSNKKSNSSNLLSIFQWRNFICYQCNNLIHIKRLITYLLVWMSYICYQARLFQYVSFILIYVVLWENTFQAFKTFLFLLPSI